MLATTVAKNRTVNNLNTIALQACGKCNKSLSLLASTVLAAILLLTQVSFSQTETNLHSFTGVRGDGAAPQGMLVSDSAGNLYGTTFSGGQHGRPCAMQGCGTVFELSPAPGGGYTETIIYTFTGGLDGAGPSAGLILDSSGNLFGSTSFGGVQGEFCSEGTLHGCGVIFELAPKAGGGWTQSVLYSFSGNPDGSDSQAPLAMDASGNLYGTTSLGAATKGCRAGCGEVFRLAPNGTGAWIYTRIHAFTDGIDGGGPQSGVTIDAKNNLFVTTDFGGDKNYCASDGCGTVDEFSPTGLGTYTGRVIYSFHGAGDGATPVGGLAIDLAGNLYGTTLEGGSTSGPCNGLGEYGGCGVVFELSPTTVGFKGHVLYRFSGTNNIANPSSTLTLDSSGDLFGTGYSEIDSLGFVFELSPNGNAGWNETTLHSFTGGTDGNVTLNGGVILGADGNLLGLASQGGIPGSCSTIANGCGLVYEITP